MIEPIISLAFSLHSHKGAYALLLGSGVSRSAGIPTGWEIVLDLIRKLARLRGENCEPEPEAWYKATFGEDAHYSKLLDSIAKSGAERQQLLKGYFEPTEEDRERGIKQPTAAHKAIAQLVSSGHIRVIVTTNFDRLIEKAVEAAGIVPVVISSPDAAEGAMPLTHSQCTVVKLHGDYLDTRAKNTVAELEHYDERISRLLDRVFEEFGVIICGWSGEWDTALRGAFERCSARRFTTYWAMRGQLGEVAKRLADHRQATTIQISDADSFFADLAGKVQALDDIERPHPLSAKVAVATLKRQLAADQRISIHDLVMAEVEKLHGGLSPTAFPVHGRSQTGEDLLHRLQKYEALSEIVQSLIITGVYWGGGYDDLWMKSLQRIGRPSGDINGSSTLLVQARLYPAFLLLYSAGISAIAAEKYSILNLLLTKTKIRDDFGENIAVAKLCHTKVIGYEWAKLLPGLERRRTPLNDRLYEVLRKPFAELLPDDIQYQRAFDRFEYLFALVYMDVNKGAWAPPGRYSWNSGSCYPGIWIVQEVDSEIKEFGNEWPPLKAGLFGGDMQRLEAARTSLHEFIGKLGWHW